MSYMQIVARFLERDNWNPEWIEGYNAYKMKFSGDNGVTTCFADVDENSRVFLFYVRVSTPVPEDRRLLMAEFITRANYGLNMGNFEMDFTDGEVRYKNSLDFEPIELTDDVIRSIVYPAVQTMDQYLVGLTYLIENNDQSPLELINKIESN